MTNASGLPPLGKIAELIFGVNIFRTNWHRLVMVNTNDKFEYMISGIKKKTFKLKNTTLL